MNATGTSHPSNGPRRRIRWVPLFFGVIAPLVELASIVVVGQSIGGGRTFALLLAGVVVGAMVISAQGRRAREALQATLAAQRGDLSATAPREVKGRGWLLVSGLLFIAPGFASDLVALLLFIPPVRVALSAGMAALGVRWFRTIEDQVVAPGSRWRPGDVVPGQVVPEQSSPTTREVKDPGVIEGRIVEE